MWQRIQDSLDCSAQHKFHQKLQDFKLLHTTNVKETGAFQNVSDFFIFVHMPEIIRYIAVSTFRMNEDIRSYSW